MRRLLMIAYHFPPLAGSSGIQRTLRFVQQLPALGWQPLVLTTHARAYERVSGDLLSDVPSGTVVRRAFALDAARHLSISGRYLDSMANPDRWKSWRFDAVRQGLRLIREFSPDAIWTTYPIPTAHVIGHELSQKSGLPWIADFRDPMAQDDYPEDPEVRARFRSIELMAVKNARACCFTTPGAARTYQARYPEAAARMHVLENGYDEDTFARAELALGAPLPLNAELVTLLHSGIVYPTERDPCHLLEALGRLRQDNSTLASKLRVRFRAAVSEDLIRGLAQQNGVLDLIEVLPPLGYAEALSEMLRADGLLLMQGGSCNDQIPAKVYEYMRTKRPILCLSHPDGDTCEVLNRAGVASGAALDDTAGILGLLNDFLVNLRDKWVPDSTAVAASARQSRTVELARLLDSFA